MTLELVKTMTTPMLSTRNFFISSALVLILLVLTEPAMALNVEKIGQGLVGDKRLKMAKLKEYVGYFGIFFIVLGIVVTAFRKHKFALQKRHDTNAAAGPFLIVFGAILAAIGYLG